MPTSASFRINQPAVISEVIDGEAIIVNLDTGAYYSLRDSGCAIWNLLLQERSMPDVVDAMTAQYNGAAPEIEAAVADLVAELQAEQLIVPGDQPNASHSPKAPIYRQNGDRLPFQQPVLEKFTDMADLLLLDPIHEVEEMGWPHAAAARESEHA